MLWRGVFLGAAAVLLAEWLHVASIFHNFLSVPVGAAPKFVANSFVNAAAHGELLTVVMIVAATLIALSSCYQIVRNLSWHGHSMQAVQVLCHNQQKGQSSGPAFLFVQFGSLIFLGKCVETKCTNNSKQSNTVRVGLLWSPIILPRKGQNYWRKFTIVTTFLCSFYFFSAPSSFKQNKEK